MIRSPLFLILRAGMVLRVPLPPYPVARRVTVTVTAYAVPVLVYVVTENGLDAFNAGVNFPVLAGDNVADKTHAFRVVVPSGTNSYLLIKNPDPKAWTSMSYSIT